MNDSAPLKLPRRDPAAHKGTFGRVLLVGGSRGMSGSIALSSIAALHTGSGLVTAAVPDRCLETVASFHPAIMTIPLSDDGLGRFSVDAAGAVGDLLKTRDAIACGPGMTTQAGSIRIVERVMQCVSIGRVLDADAINALALIDWAAVGSDSGPLVLTPHPGEFARLTGVSSADSDAQATEAAELAERTGAIIVLKGAPTLVFRAGETWTNSTGNPALATAGSGDVLTGVIASLIGQGMSVWDSARLGVWMHGRAGDLAADQIGQPGVTAQEIVAAVPQVAASLVG